MREKRHNKRNLNIMKTILCLLFLVIILVIVLLLIAFNHPIIENTISTVNNYVTNSYADNSGYDIIKQDENPNYLGVGQQKVEGKNGYFTTFATSPNEVYEKTVIEASSNLENYKTYKEYKQNGTSSWSNNPYWEGTMETDGCSITALSIILSGYGKNFTPEMLRVRYFPVLNMDNLSSELSNTFGIKNSGFLFDSVHLSNDYIDKHLQTGRPVLVCVWNNPSNNRWTTASHYMVLLATDSNGMVYVSNPNGLENSSKSSGWYDINEVTKYIAKALFIESY